MGWWDNGTDPGPVKSEAHRVWWGDGPADILDNALWQIQAAFVREFGRVPSKREIMAGIAFSIGPDAQHMDLPDTPNDALFVSVTDRETLDKAYHATFADPRTPTTLSDHITATNRVREVMGRAIKPYRKNT